MEVCDEEDSDYRVLIDGHVKYLTIAPGTYDRPTLSMPLDSLPSLPNGGGWNVAYISRDSATGELKTDLRSIPLAGVQDIWHPTSIDCLDLLRLRQLILATFEASCPTQHLSPTKGPLSPTPATIVVAKIARFEWEVPRIEQETRV